MINFTTVRTVAVGILAGAAAATALFSAGPAVADEDFKIPTNLGVSGTAINDVAVIDRPYGTWEVGTIRAGESVSVDPNCKSYQWCKVYSAYLPTGNGWVMGYELDIDR